MTQQTNKIMARTARLHVRTKRIMTNAERCLKTCPAGHTVYVNDNDVVRTRPTAEVPVGVIIFSHEFLCNEYGEMYECVFDTRS